jgi:hypothetical protein
MANVEPAVKPALRCNIDRMICDENTLFLFVHVVCYIPFSMPSATSKVLSRLKARLSRWVILTSEGSEPQLPILDTSYPPMAGCRNALS